MSDPFDDKLLGDLDEAAQPPPLQQGFAVPMDRVEMRKRTKAITAMLQVFLKAGKTLRLYSSDHHFFSMFQIRRNSRRIPSSQESSCYIFTISNRIRGNSSRTRWRWRLR